MMKRIALLGFAVLAVFAAATGLLACWRTCASAPAVSDGLGQPRILVAYFSRSGNTEVLAQVIALETGGRLFRIIPAVPYSDNYRETVARFQYERDNRIRPAVASKVDDMAQYDVVFVGYPNWGSDIPPVVQSFLTQYDFSGKTIVPFCTHGGGGFGHSMETLKTLCPDSVIRQGFEVNGRRVVQSGDDIALWLERIGLKPGY